MAKLNLKTSFSNSVITKIEGVFFIEEFDSKGESKGKYNLTEKLDGVLDTEGIKLNFDVTNELESEF